MKKMFIWAAAAMMLCAANLQAQPQGGYPGRNGQAREFKMPEILPDSVFASNRTADMVEKYNLTEEQEEQVAQLNFKYAPMLQVKMTGFGQQNGEQPRDFRSMSDEERQEFFDQMQERMQQAQEAEQARAEAQKAFDKAMKDILDKEQYKAYTKDRKREDRERTARNRQMQGGMGGPRGGMGGPGGGFGGPGGGFGGPGGGFGGPGGF